MDPPTYETKSAAVQFVLAAALGLAMLASDVGLSAAESEWVYRAGSGRLVYVPDADGDRIPDFSGVGFDGGRTPIPMVPHAVTVSPVDGDDTASIQRAINIVSRMPMGLDGFRGAVLLEAGNYDIGGQLSITASGVVLRGSGNQSHQTVLHGRGTQQRDLIRIDGGGVAWTHSASMVDKVVPVGAQSFRVDTTAGLAVGQTIRVTRPSTANWISDIGMDNIPPRADGQPITQWAPGSRDIHFERVITHFDGDRVFLDAPLTNSFEARYGGGTIRRASSDTRLANVGIENLRAESDFSSPTDEDHAWNFVSIRDAQDVWVRDVETHHFGRSAVLVNPTGKRVTVQRVRSHDPVSRIAGSRRYTFDLSGQLELVTDSEANFGRHDFVNNSSRPPGPHVFHNSVAHNALSDSGPHQRWATGSLFDNITVEGNLLNSRNRGNFGTGHGWSGANMVIWNSTADGYIVQSPPTAQNWLIGSVGPQIEDQRFGPQPPGYIDSHGMPIGSIPSLYEAQVADAADVREFHWSGSDGNWHDASAWREQLVPGTYEIHHRDYLVGDIDDFTDDGPNSVDAQRLDADFSRLLSEAGHTPMPLDRFDSDGSVAFSLMPNLEASDRVAHATLAMALRQPGAGRKPGFVQLTDDDPENRSSFADLGWETALSSGETFVGVLDVTAQLEDLQSGGLNVQVSDTVGADWALFTISVARPTDLARADVMIERGGQVTLDRSPMRIGTLSLGGQSPGGLQILESAGTLDLTHYVQSPNGSLVLALGDHRTTRLQVQQRAELAGTLQIAGTANGVAAGDRFSILFAGAGVEGEFSQVVLPSPTAGLIWDLAYLPDAVTLSAFFQADFNRDGNVDGEDLFQWQAALGSTAQGDADGDHDTDGSDFLIWQKLFGSIAAPTAASGVPEPSSWLLLLAGLAGTVHRRLRSMHEFDVQGGV